jgi:putative transposase
MAESQSMTTPEVVAKTLIAEHGDFLRDAVAMVAAQLMEAEIAGEIGAGRGERSADRATHRNGYRERLWETRVGEIELAVPRKRSGEAYVNGVSTRKVDRLVEQLGISSMSKDRVSALCRDLDERVDSFRQRPLEGAFPYLWLDAKHLKVRDRGSVRSKALVIAYAVHETGRREVIGIDIGETEAFWVAFLRELVARGLSGVRLAISDEHRGLKAAIARVLACPWQRCTVHFVRNMHGHCRRDERGLVSAALREIFAAPDAEAARERFGAVLERFGPTVPKVAELLEEAEEDLLAFYAFPAPHWPKLRSTNPLERVNREVGRRSDVVGIFPNDASALRHAGALLIEQNDEWLVARRYLSAESIALALEGQGDEGGEEVAALQAA